MSTCHCRGNNTPNYATLLLFVKGVKDQLGGTYAVLGELEGTFVFGNAEQFNDAALVGSVARNLPHERADKLQQQPTHPPECTSHIHMIRGKRQLVAYAFGTERMSPGRPS